MNYIDIKQKSTNGYTNIPIFVCYWLYLFYRKRIYSTSSCSLFKLFKNLWMLRCQAYRDKTLQYLYDICLWLNKSCIGNLWVDIISFQLRICFFLFTTFIYNFYFCFFCFFLDRTPLPLSLLRFPGSNETAQKIIFRPHKNWKEVMLDPNLLDLVFKVEILYQFPFFNFFFALDV